MSTRQKLAPILILAAIAAAALYWWQSTIPQPALEGPKTTGLPMKSARYYWPGQYWIEIAEKKGWFEEAGLNVEIIDTNPDYYQSLSDMAAGKLDVQNFTLFDLISYRLGEKDLVMFLCADSSAGAEGIVARPGISSLKDLKGKRIGVSVGTYTDYILEVVLKKNALRSSDIIKVEILEEQAVESFTRHNLDAIVTWEPELTNVMKAINGRKLFDTSQIPGVSYNGQVFHQSFINERPGDVQAYVRVWHKTTEFMKRNPEEAFGIIAKIYGVTPGEVQAFTQLDKIMDLADNLTAFSYAAGFESLHGSARQINNYMIAAGITDKQFDSTEFLNADFIRALARE
jgi:NitT/TauT family transport system substrate-binding protein